MKKILSFIFIASLLTVNLYGSSIGDNANVLFKHKTPILLRPAKEKFETLKITFPDFKPQANKTLCLRFKAYLKTALDGGCNTHLGLKLNGRQLGEKLSNGNLRLLNKQDSLKVLYGKKLRFFPWWKTNANIPCLMLLFSTGKAPYNMSRVIGFKDTGFEYLLDVSDFASQVISEKASN